MQTRLTFSTTVSLASLPPIPSPRAAEMVSRQCHWSSWAAWPPLPPSCRRGRLRRFCVTYVHSYHVRTTGPRQQLSEMRPDQVTRVLVVSIRLPSANTETQAQIGMAREEGMYIRYLELVGQRDKGEAVRHSTRM